MELSCFDTVEEFIKRHEIDGFVKRYESPVETVERASQVAGVSPSDIVKTVVISYSNGFATVIVPGERAVDLKKVSQVLGVKKVRLARPDEIREITGFEVGGVSPLSECVRRNTVIVLDTRILTKEFVWCGGGNRYSLAYVPVRRLVEVLNPLVADVSIERV